MPGDYDTLLLEPVGEGIVLLTLNRPDRLNAITFEMFDELHAACGELASDTDVRVVIITGAGRGFCSGLDLDEAEKLPEMSAREMMQGQERWGGAMAAIRELPQPVIAAVNGPAAGGGLAVALAADIRVASTEARFNAAFVKIGLTSGDIGVSWALPRIVGLGHAAEIMLTGRFVGPEEAARIGLVNRVVAPDALLQEAIDLAAEIVSNTPFGVTMSKRVLNLNVDAGSFRSALEAENRGQTLATRGQDFREALAAFREKRAPDFSGS